MRQFNIRHNSYALRINEAPRRIALNASSLSRYISQFLGTSKGRDKFMSVLQYSFDFYHSCTKHSNIQQVRKLLAYQELPGIVVAEKFKDSISQSRKIFRLLYFLDEIKGIQRVLKQNKPTSFKILSLLGHYASFMYYVSDNLMWIIAVCVQSGVINPKNEQVWKQRKNSFSQMRIVLNIIRLLAILMMRDNKSKQLIQKIGNVNSQETSQELCLSLLKLMRKRRFELLDLLLSMLRFFMLTKSLKMAGYQYLDPVFVATCGLLSSGIALFKAMYEKKIFIQLDNQQHNDSRGITKILSKGFASSIKMDNNNPLI